MKNFKKFFILAVGLTLSIFIEAEGQDSTSIIPLDATPAFSSWKVLSAGTTTACMYANAGITSTTSTIQTNTSARCSAPTPTPMAFTAFRADCNFNSGGIKSYGFVITNCSLTPNYDILCTDARRVVDNTVAGDGGIQLYWMVMCGP